jgi:phosphate:Na+ symporter
VGFLAFTFVAFAAEADATKAGSPDWLQLGLGLFGGLALFLAGLQLLSEGMKKAAGQAMTTVLAQLTTNRFMGALTGAFVTGVLNSSTVTTLLVVGFISGGMMTLAQSVGVIMGAKIGLLRKRMLKWYAQKGIFCSFSKLSIIYRGPTPGLR